MCGPGGFQPPVACHFRGLKTFGAFEESASYPPLLDFRYSAAYACVMRLSPSQAQAIRTAVARQDPAARVILFGSRADDHARGGDIDLLVISESLGLRDEWRIRRDILDEIGWQKLDLIV